jgi:beta propeller repeat protein
MVILLYGVNNGNIYMRNITTHKTTQITANGVSGDPKIYGNNIVFDTDSHSGNNYSNNIYIYGISSGKITQITKSNCAFQPAISGNKIVYVDYRNANTRDIDFKDLFIYDLTSKLTKPAGIIAANVTSGTHPFTVFFGYREDGDMATSYLWNFGDGITSTHTWTATHTYTKKGTYTVSLKVSNGAGSAIITKTKYITVT